MIDLPSVNFMSLLPLAGVLKEVLQRPVETSHTLTIPAESLEIAIPSLACILIDSIDAELVGMGVGSIATWSTNKVSISQNLTVLSSDAEIREEENMRELIKCYVRIRPDPDVPRGEMKTESGGQLLTAHTRTRAGRTSTRAEETGDGRSRAGGSERSEEPQTETRGELSNISSEVLEYKYMKYIY